MKNKADRTDVFGLTAMGNEPALIEAYNNGDTLEVGRIVELQIKRSIEYRVLGETILLAKYRAKIMQELTEGTDA